MNEDLIVTQIGLIFSQIRSLRMAVEQLERNTSRYAGIALDAAFAGPGGFGAPPLYQGALRVYVTNISDLLASDNSFMGFLGGIFRGISALAGGFVAGVLNAFTLPVTIGLIGRITGDVLQILRLLGSSGTGNTAPAASPGRTGGQEPSGLMAMLDKIERVAQQLREVLGLVNEQQQGSVPVTETPAARGAMTMLQAVSRIVDGLIILVPVLIGAFASLLLKVEQLKIGLIDMLEFAVRNVLLLRGVILVVLYDTAASAARLAASLITIIGSAVGGILSAVFRMIESALVAVTSAFSALSRGLAAVVNALLPWLVNTVLITLRNIGELRVFRMVFALVEILPSVLPSILSLLGRPLTTGQITALEDARTRMVTTFGRATSALTPLPAMPDVASDPRVVSALATTTTAITGATTVMGREVGNVFSGAAGALRDISQAMNAAVGPGGEGLNRSVREHMGGVISTATALTESLRSARDTARSTGVTGLEAIAGAYEGWLRQGGLDQVLQRINAHFSGVATTPSGGLLGRVTELVGSLTARVTGDVETPRPTVEIPEVTVEITIAQPAPVEPPAPLFTPPRVFRASLDVDEDELLERGAVSVA